MGACLNSAGRRSRRVSYATSPNDEITGQDDLLSLWSRYRKSGDQSARSELLDRHLPLVRLLARRLAARTGGAVEVDDLMSAGTIGLVQAVESYDLSRANSFATYASRRIHGAMLDELRSRDWVPRSVRAKARKLQHAAGRVEAVLGRMAAPNEMAAVLQIDLPTYWNWRRSVDTTVPVSLDEGGTAMDTRIDHDEERACSLETLARAEDVQQLADALGTLPERERLVLVLYFYEELNLREIAEILHLTESRISQIRTSALARLRSMLAKWAA